VPATTTPSLRTGPHTVDPPVVLAGLYVCEMITSRAMVERDPTKMHMITFHPDEQPRSLQLHGVDPVTMGKAVQMIVDEDLADHLDMNFECPKSTH
jgi:tRNA-dihydrouridine synthase